MDDIQWQIYMNIEREEPRSSVVGSGTMLQAGRSRARFPMSSLDFSIMYSFRRKMTHGSTQPLTKLRTKNLPVVGKGGQRIRLTSPQPVCRLSI
jgi:hypothetical protein